MNETDIRIVRLEPFKVASTYGFGPQPEDIAWEKMFKWLKSVDLWQKMGEQQLYGFNNPNPSPGSPNYGYEQWVVINKEYEPSKDVEFKSFTGGLYAVTRCYGIPEIGDKWQQLFRWRQNSSYQSASHQWLEKLTNPSQDPLDMHKMVMDLYIPISE
jgi:DNA gyrase inhibitor GyrI